MGQLKTISIYLFVCGVIPFLFLWLVGLMICGPSVGFEECWGDGPSDYEQMMHESH
jgi:hypothetical protein